MLPNTKLKKIRKMAVMYFQSKAEMRGGIFITIEVEKIRDPLLKRFIFIFEIYKHHTVFVYKKHFSDNASLTMIKESEDYLPIPFLQGKHK